MGVFIRKDSPYYWHYLERPGRKGLSRSTRIRVDAPTPAMRKDQRQLADEVYHQRMAQLLRNDYELPGADPAPPGMTFGAWATWYLAHVVPTHRGADRDAWTIALLRQAFEHVPLTAITRRLVSEWTTTRLTTPRVLKPTGPKGAPRHLPPPKPGTVNREVAVLKAMLQAAVEAGHLPASPLYGMKLLRGKKPKRRIMTPAEETKILAQLSPADQAVVVAGLDTLCRLTDLLDLAWSDDHGAYLYVAQPKRGEPYTVPVSRRLRAALKKVPRTDSPFIFAHRRGSKTERDRRCSVRQMFEAACKRAGVPYGRNVGGITFHWATRRTGASRMLSRGASLPTVQRVGNWANPHTLLGIYAEAMTVDIRRAVELVAPTSRGDQ